MQREPLAHQGSDRHVHLFLRDELGKELGYSKERVRQIESRALKKLRANAEIYHLKEYLN